MRASHHRSTMIATLDRLENDDTSAQRDDAAATFCQAR
jgi:hypothetical protein